MRKSQIYLITLVSDSDIMIYPDGFTTSKVVVLKQRHYNLAPLGLVAFSVARELVR